MKSDFFFAVFLNFGRHGTIILGALLNFIISYEVYSLRKLTSSSYRMKPVANQN